MNIQQQLLRELDTEPENSELNCVFEQLEQYQVEPPSPAVTHQLIHSLKLVLLRERLMVTRERRFKEAMAGTRQNRKFPSLLRLVGLQLTLMSKWFIALTMAVLAAGVMLTGVFESSSTKFLVAAAPLVGLLTLLYEYRAQLHRVAEMEATCLYSPAQLATARILIVLGYSILLCTAATVLENSAYHNAGWKIILNWLAPLLLIVGIALVASLRLGIAGGCTTAGIVWLTQLTLMNGSSLLSLLLPGMTGLALNMINMLLGGGLIWFALQRQTAESLTQAQH